MFLFRKLCAVYLNLLWGDPPLPVPVSFVLLFVLQFLNGTLLGTHKVLEKNKLTKKDKGKFVFMNILAQFFNINSLQHP